MATTETSRRRSAYREAGRAIAAHGLLAPSVSEPIGVREEEEPEFLAFLEGHKLTGLAAAAAGAGRLRLSDERSQELAEEHRKSMLWALGLERTLLELADELESAGVDAVVLKGPAVAHTVYPDPSWRPFADLDLLVRTKEWRRAIAVLEGRGLERRLPEPRRGFDERFAKAAVFRGPRRQEIDLHRNLAQGPFGIWVQPDELFEHTVEFRLGGRTLRRLSDTALLAHACIHAVLGIEKPLLLTIRDVAQVEAAADVDWGLMEEWAGRWRLGVVFRHAFELATNLCGTPWPIASTTAFSGTRRDLRALEAYTTSRRHRGGAALATLRAIPGVRGRAAYLRALVAPRRAFVEIRQGSGSVTSYLRRLAVPVRWLTTRGRTR